jgi:cytochrome b6-f complex iron-sulfur subunit
MALARAKKEAAQEPTPKPAAAKAASPAPKAAAAKPAAKPAAVTGAAKTGVQRDTASILAAARAAAKPGPVSKADAPPRPVAKPKEPRPVEERSAPPRTVATVPPKPVKPAKKGEEAEDRRGFLQIALGSAMAVGFSALSVTGGLFSLGLARFLFPNVLAEPPSKFKVGFKDAFPSGKVETKFVPQYGVWVVNGDFQGQQQIYALKTVCTHLGCTPSWLEAEQKFKCPCHGSGFYKDGVNFEGPAPRPLERYAIRVADDGQLEIDKSRTFQEELGQWADPESYVTV